MSRAKKNVHTPATASDKPGLFWKIVIGLLLVAILWIASYLTIWTYFGNLTDASAFGGMFGAVGALFSGLALAGLVGALLQQRDDLRMQREELALQREELTLTRKELKRSAEAQEKSEQALAAQAEAGRISAQLAALQFMPLLDMSASRYEGETHIHIKNLGDTAAFDVEIRSLALYHENDIDLKKFIDENVIRSDDRLKTWNPLLRGDEFAVSDERGAYILPAGRSLKGRLVLAKPRLNRLLVLLQFRDLRAANFSQIYAFAEVKKGHGVYPIADKQPSIPLTSPRIEKVDSVKAYIGEPEEDTFMLPLGANGGTDLPDHVKSEFAWMWQKSLPGSFISEKYLFGGGGLELVEDITPPRVQ